MSDHAAAEYLRSLRERRALYQQGAVDELRTLFRRRDRRPPEEFHDSSFLYMRSYDADAGARPFSGIVYWHSPDLTLTPVTSPGAYTTTLNAGETYVVRCALRNRGDIGVPAAKVELFLTDPSLGFDTRFATNLTLGRVPSAWVASNTHTAVELLYTVPPSESGHKCLFARTFSFSPLDLPIDDFALDPLLDRHVAQQNLNIVGQAQAYAFALVHAPNARIRIQMRALEPEELLALRHPVLADVQPAREFPRRGWERTSRVQLRQSGGGEIAVALDERGVAVQARDPEGLGLDEQRELKRAVRDVLRAVGDGETRLSAHRELLRRFRKMNAQARRSAFAMTVPHIGLQPRQAVGLEISAVDENTDPAETVGGITVIIRDE